MNARTALERQWAAVCLRRPSYRLVLAKYLHMFGIEGYWVTWEDPHAALVVQAAIALAAPTPVTKAVLDKQAALPPQPMDLRAVAAYIADRDFAMDADDALHFVRGLVDALPADADLDIDRLAIAVLAAMGITLPEHETNDYLIDPYGLRAEQMRARKVRAAR